MPARYLLDTNTVGYAIKGRPPWVRERLAVVPVREVAISVVTEAELRFGVGRLSQATSLARLVEEFLLRVDVLPWDSDAAKQYARVRLEVEKQGQGNLDLMIAAQALAGEAVLITADRAFNRIRGLQTQDWTKP